MPKTVSDILRRHAADRYYGTDQAIADIIALLPKEKEIVSNIKFKQKYDINKFKFFINGNEARRLTQIIVYNEALKDCREAIKGDE